MIDPPPPLVHSTIEVFEGDNVTLAVPVASNPAPYLFQLTRDQPGSSSKSTRNPPAIYEVQRAEAGDYLVTVTNRMKITGSGERDGQGTQMIKLRVLCRFRGFQSFYICLVVILNTSFLSHIVSSA